FGFNRQLLIDRRVSVLVEEIVDDVHFAADTPFCPGFAVAKVDNARVRLVKLNIQIAQQRVPKTCDVSGRSSHQFVVRTELMPIGKLLEIRLRNQLRRWIPDKFAAELKLAHAKLM